MKGSFLQRREKKLFSFPHIKRNLAKRLAAAAAAGLTGLGGLAAASETVWAANTPQPPQPQSSQTENAGMPVEVPAKSAILMEQSTGKVLCEMNADEQMPPASITKIMTLLLVMEAVESGRLSVDETVSASPHACSMGGSQIWLEPGEQMSVRDLIKATAVASANDASVALGEQIAGSEEAFVDQMNQRAAELGMSRTHFVNCTGLDAQGHLTTARDIAIMAKELIRHPMIREYSSIWMDSLRDGATQLVNTNKLVRFYDGATGLKTGTTDGAGSCLAATATRGGLSLVAVSLGSATSDERFTSCRRMLDYGFANYSLAQPPAMDDQFLPVKVLGGVQESMMPVSRQPEGIVVKKGEEKKLEQTLEIAPEVEAPVKKGQVIGNVVVRIDGKEVGRYAVEAAEDVPEMNFGTAFVRLLAAAVDFRDKTA